MVDEIADEITDAVFEGPGPFATPLLANFVEINSLAGKDFAIATFEFEDGARVLLPISILAADMLLQAVADWKKFRQDVASSGPFVQ
jgi:hypothetical protein